MPTHSMIRDPAPQLGWTLPPAELVLLGAIWGASYLLMRVAAPSIGPVALVEIRLLLGALILLPALWRHRAAFPIGLWPKIALVGAINSALPFLLYAWAAHAAPVGVSAITSAMTVSFAAAVGWVFYRERVGSRRAIAIALGLVGVIVLASGRGATGEAFGAAVVAGTAASLMYGTGLHLVRRHLAGLPSAALACASLGSSALVVLPFALAEWPHKPVPAAAWAAAAALGVLCTGLAYVLYYRLVARVGVARTSTVTYLIPVFGMTWGWLMLGEQVTPTMIFATMLVLGSLAIGQRSEMPDLPKRTKAQCRGPAVGRRAKGRKCATALPRA